MSLLEDILVEDDGDHGHHEYDHHHGQARPHDHDDDDGVEQIMREDSDNNSDDPRSQAEEDKPQRVDPNKEKKVKVIKNPRAVLNPKRLTGPRGIQIIEDFFKDFQFQGKGHEVEDLDLMMKKLEHWAHRLYPKFQFDDCIEKIALLGSKKQVVTHIKRIRMNLIQEDVPIVNQSDSEDEGNTNRGPVLDEFDVLLDQQIALARSTPASNLKTVVQYDDSPAQTSNMEVAVDVPNNLPVNVTPIRTNSSLSEEQVARMMKNRLLAEERRLVRMKAAQEKEKTDSVDMNTEEVSNSLQNTEEICDSLQNTEEICSSLKNTEEISYLD